MANNPIPQRRLPVVQIVLLTLWGLLTALMLLAVVVGLACAALGLVSLLVDLGGVLEIRLGGEVVRTTAQKSELIALGVVLVGLGVCFWRLNRRGSLVGALLCYIALLALFGAIAWATGSAEVLSVGGP